MFAGLTNADILNTNTEYTLTFNSGAILQPFESTIFNGLRERSLEATILKVSRSFGSGRYAVTIQPSTEHNLQYWIDSFTAMLYDMGYKKATYQTVDVGKTSSQTGGVKQVVKETVDATAGMAGDTILSLIKNLWLPLTLIAGVYLGGMYIKGKAGAVVHSNPKRRKYVRRNKRR